MVKRISRTPTLEDVARAAGVSTATVSRCLNNPNKVVEKTRNRVLAVVTRLGYAPNFNARALAARRTETIGAVIPTMENAIFAEGVQAFQRVLQAEGFTLLIASSNYDPATEAEVIRKLVARGADGLLLVGFDRSPDTYSFLEAQSIPAVVGWAYDARGALPSVGFDNAAAMAALVRHAIDLGHKRVGMISGVTSGNDRARLRLEGVASVLGDAGLSPPTVVEARYELAEGSQAFDTLRKEAKDLTLIICGNDVLAAGALRRAREVGMSVPDDISITGFDDIGLAQVVDPPLTTVRVPHRTMGEAAARLLLDLLEEIGPECRQLPTELCLRKSLAKPRDR